MRLESVSLKKYNKYPEEWVQYLKKHNYTAAYCPVDNSASDDLIEAYVDLARENIVIAG